VDAIVNEPVGTLEDIDQLLAARLKESGVQLLLGGALNDSQHRAGRDIAETGELLQRLLGCSRKPGEFAYHQVSHVVGVTLGVDALEIPRPARMHGIERDQSLICQCRQELIDEKRITAGFPQNQLS